MTPSPTGIPAVDAVLVWGGAATVLGGAATMAWRSIAGARRLAGRLDEFIDDWSGTEPRPGVPARPGVMERLGGIEQRLASVEHELHPNSGASLRDAVNRVDVRTARLCEETE
ncbi:hypothetical protein BJP40_26920 [Streptomyces sp. CC53]|uniref:hypothetical protein n=1 Tax=Streptomyces sp. CC53 TaxID=1906740 RepID=UPI0008DD5D02|nr:hypothetical protein [Streptomyces sp. CC53]OII62872.1 hypothetical protein BJP40_26920 [Streptomyces sp. CC53]